MKNQLTNLTNKFSLAVKAINAIESRMNSYDTMDSFVLGLLLDPRYNILLSQQARETARTLITTYNYENKEPEVDTNLTPFEAQEFSTESTDTNIDEIEAILLKASTLKLVTLISQKVNDRQAALKLEVDQFETTKTFTHRTSFKLVES